MYSPIRTGILAYGMSGRLFHAPFIAGNSYFEFAAIVERSGSEAIKRYPQARHYTNVEALLADSTIELVIVNTPNYLHYKHVRLALDHGKHVLVEKPFVPTSAEAKELFAYAQSLNLGLYVYQNRRFDSDFKAVQQLVQGGDLGKLIEMHIRFDRYRAYIGPKAFKESPFPGSGIGYDLGSHLIDQCIALFGQPLKSLKIGTKNRENTQVEDYVHFILCYPEAFMVYVTATYLAADPGPAYVIHGRKGSFKKMLSDVQEQQLDAGISPFSAQYGQEDLDLRGRITRVDPDGTRHTDNQVGQQGNYNELFNALYEAIRLGKPFPITPMQVIQQLQILEQSPLPLN